MNLKPVSWHGLLFADYDISAFIPDSSELVYPAQAVISERGGTFPKSIDRRYTNPVTTALQFHYLGSVADEPEFFATVMEWFQTLTDPIAGLDENFGVIVADDLDDDLGGGIYRQWQILCAPLNVAHENNLVTVLFLIKEPYWRVDQPETDTWNITASGQTHTFDAIGKLAEPIFTINPTTDRSNAAYRRFVDVQPPSTTINLGKYPLDIGSALNTGALVAAGKALANGDDFRVWVDGMEVSRWFSGFNTASTKIWTTLDWKTKVTLSLGEVIAGAGDLTYIQFKTDATNVAAFAKLPENGIIKIGSEYFVYLAKDVAKNRVTCGTQPFVERAAKGSAAAAHAVSDTCIWIQHDIWFVYGNPGATAPELDLSQKPTFDLDSSTNTSWVYTDFFDYTNLYRPMRWFGQAYKTSLYNNSKQSRAYTETQGAFATALASVMGIDLLTAPFYDQWRGESVSGEWHLTNPAGFISIAISSGKHYRNYTGTYPIPEILGANDTLMNYENIYTIPWTGSLSAWNPFTVSTTVFVKTYIQVQIRVQGQIPAAPSTVVWPNSYRVALEASTLTLGVSSAALPVVSVGAEQSGYLIDCIITNNENAYSLRITQPIPLNKQLIINCATHRAYLNDNTPVQGCVRRQNSRRTAWMVFEPGANELSFIDVDTGNITITEQHYSRTNLKP